MSDVLSQRMAAGFQKWVMQWQVQHGQVLTGRELTLAQLAYGEGFVQASEIGNATIRAMVDSVRRPRP